MDLKSKIYVAGHEGLVGSALMKRLVSLGYGNVITRSRRELDLTDRPKVAAFFSEERPEYVFLAAAKVGGILANYSYPADFIMENILIETSVIDACYRSGVRKLLFLGSSCAYPRVAREPIKEEYLLAGSPEPTNSAYAMAN